MSLFGTIQNSGNALITAQIGLQVTGNNIANANTPGYVRERVNLTPTPTQRLGTLLLGTGVRVHSVVQEIDLFLQEQLRSANSDLASGEAQENAYAQLEGLVGELSSTDLSSSLSRFFNSIHDILNEPGSSSLRTIAVRQGEALAADIRRLSEKAVAIHQGINQQVIDQAADINRLITELAELNIEIAAAEGGDATQTEAGGLRDRRSAALYKLSQIIDVRTSQQADGTVSVYSGGDFLVFQGIHRDVSVVPSQADGLATLEIHITETDARVGTGSGRVAGLTAARDTVLARFLDQLDTVAAALVTDFNRLYSSGQGTVGFQSVTSEYSVDDANADLDQAGFAATPVNGSFKLVVKNALSGDTNTTLVRVDLNGLDDDTSLSQLATQLDAIDGITSSVTSKGMLRISADDPNLSFSFSSDTSGILAALGINTLFTGSGAGDIGIHSDVLADARRFATSLGGVGEDTQNAELLATFLQAPLETHNGLSLAQLYEQLVSDTTQGSASVKAVTEGFRAYQQTLEGQNLAMTGVNLDEEAVKMIAYQRMYQASAKVIATANSLLETLLNL